MKTKEHNDARELIWTGVVFAIALIILIKPLIMQENAYRRVEGEIVSSFVGEGRLQIVLNTSRTHYNVAGSYSDELREKAAVGKVAVIWYRRPLPSRSARPEIFIQKMIVDNEVVIPFRRRIGMNFIFIGVLLAPLIAIIIHFVRKGRKRVDEIESSN